MLTTCMMILCTKSHQLNSVYLYYYQYMYGFFTVYTSYCNIYKESKLAATKVNK